MKVKDKQAGKLNLGMRCGDCIHFKTGPKSPLYKDRCSLLGVKNYARACQGYTPNSTLLNRKDGSLEAAAKIARLTESMNASQKRVLGYLLTKTSTSLEKMGLRFGQPMYMFLEPTIGLGRTALESLRDDNFNYLDNYYKAYVMGATDLEDGVREVFLASSLEGKPDYYVSINMKAKEKFKRALTAEQFAEVKESLIEQDRKRMPKKLRARLEKLHELKLLEPIGDEEVRTLDDVPWEWWSTGITADEKRARRNKGIKLTAKKPKFKNDVSIDNDGEAKPRKAKSKKIRLTDKPVRAKTKPAKKGNLRVKLIG